MPDRRTGGQSPTGAADGLVTTKLFVPRPPPGHVVRRRLAERLDDGAARGVTVVCAPAGSGKTSLLSAWSREPGRAVAWVSLDAGDNDAARFWRHVTAALGRHRPAVADRVAPLLGPAPPSPAAFVAALVNSLAADDAQVALVLDDYHVIEADDIHAAVADLVEHRPPALHLVVASRSDPPLPLTRLRARGRLAEVRAADLRFTSDEAAALLTAAAERDLPDDAVGALADRTEGWAAGLHLAGLSLRRHRDPAGFVARFDGSHRFILDYLTEEVIDQQSPQVRAFLLDTSVLRRLSGALCDAVTGRDDGQDMLERIERDNLFLTPLDDTRRWWRYHPLFADMLRARLHRDAPGRARQLHLAAAAWFDRHGFPGDAVDHALAGRDAALAADMVERHADALTMRSEGATVGRWLDALPSDVVTARPRLLLARARLALLSGRVEDAEQALDAAERAWDAGSGDTDDYMPSIEPGLSLLRNVPATIDVDRAYVAELRGDSDRALAHAERAAQRIQPGEWMLRSHADGYRGVALLLDGRVDDAERTLSATIQVWRDGGERHLAVRGYHHLAQVYRAQGRLDAAARTYRAALDLVAGTPAAGIAHVGLAEVAYQRDDLDSARAHLDEGIPLCRQLVYTQPLATGLATLAWVRHAEGHTTAAADLMAQAGDVAGDAGGVLNVVPVERLRLALTGGDVDAAERWLRRHGVGVNDDAVYAREPAHLLLARVLIAQDRPADAVALLDRLIAVADAQGRAGSLVELRTLRAIALHHSGDEPAAVRSLAEALSDACPRGYVRVFVDAGPPMPALLSRLVAARDVPGAAGAVPFDCLARLQRAFTDAPSAAGAAGPATARARAATGVGGGHAAPPAGMVEALTAREREVLELLARGGTNARIAADLVVSIDTVKKHVSRVLDKLGAANRTEAVDRARRLGLLP